MTLNTKEKGLEDLLNFDSLNTAENLTGKSYKEDKETEALGFMMHMAANSEKREKLKKTNDSYFGTSFKEFVEIAKSIGFEECYSRGFKGAGVGHDYNETETIMWHESGILLFCESFGERSLNRANIFYNWKSHAQEKDWFAGGSRGYIPCPDNPDENVIIGSYDAREGLVHHLALMHKHGTFLKPWIEEPIMFCLKNYSDYHKEEGQGNTLSEAEKIAMLPEHVRESIITEAEYGQTV